VCGSVGGVRLTRGLDRLREYLNACVGVLGCETDRGVDRLCEYLNIVKYKTT
jgi:hypothetical protein